MRNRVLVVEDEKALRSALVDKLTHEGFSVTEAKNGQEGLEQAMSDHPDCILLDIVMPIKDGMTMLAELRQDQWGKTVPVIILTNLSDLDNVSNAVSGGSYDYLIKSDWKLDDVVAKLRERLSN